MELLSSLFERFLRERRYLKNVTPKTLIWYETAFKTFTRAVGVERPTDLSKSLLGDFVVRLRERGVSPVSCNTYGKALNVFFGWLVTEGHLQQPAFAIKLPVLRPVGQILGQPSGVGQRRPL